MSVDAWIIDELERERREEEGRGERPELDIRPPETGELSIPEKEAFCERGVTILEISPCQENVIDL